MKRAVTSILSFFLLIPALLAQESYELKVVPMISSAKNTEFSPTISADGRHMIFESDVNKDKGWELFESNLDDNGTWSAPIPMQSINEKCSFLAGPSLSYDGNTLYFTAFIENVTTSEDIYYSERTENGWSEPKPIGAPINTNDSYEGFPSISADGNSMYFIRTNERHKVDSKSKENCFIIYVSHRQPDGPWGEPVALPAPINTGCERDPRILADNRTLIFSSIREGGKGKYDIYQSRKQTDNSWSDPVPLDFVNSPESDQSPCIAAAGEIMFYSRLKDIYTVTIPRAYRQMMNVTVRGRVTTERGQPVKARIYVTESGSGATFENNSNATNGTYLLVLSAGKKYSVEFVREGYIHEVIEVDFQKQDQYSENMVNIILRTSYTLLLTVDDQEHSTLVKAFVSVSNNEESYKDSISAGKYPYTLKLKAGKDYELKAAAPMFAEVKQDWRFDPRKFESEMSHTIHLAREKISYTADVTNIVSKQKSKIKVYFNNENADEVIIAEAGEVVLLSKGDRYQVMTASDKGFFFSSTTVVAGEGQADEKGGFVIPMSVMPIEVGAELNLKYITFASNSAKLNPSSMVELDRVIELMEKNPGLSIEISAHTDNVGTDAYNLRLSQSRANSVVSYLTQHGTPVERMKAVGFGKRKPRVPNNSEKNRAINRRVELRVLKFE